jgi:drug/metabolite transporter, DME family
VARAAFWVLLAAALFGTTGTAQALGPAGTSASAVGLVRIAVGGVLLGLWALRGALPRVLRQARSHPLIIRTTVVSALAVVAYQPLFFAGVRLNGVAVGTVLALGSAPVLSGLIDAVLYRRLPSRRWVVATAFAMLGMAAVSGVSPQAEGDPGALGVLASVGAGAAYAVYATGARTLITTAGFTSNHAMGLIFGLAGLVSVVVLPTQSLSWLASGRGCLMALWLAVATMAIAYLLLGRGLAVLHTPTVATLTLAEPVTATLLGILVLDEPLGPVAMVGLAVLCLGLLALAIPSRRAAAPEQIAV